MWVQETICYGIKIGRVSSHPPGWQVGYATFDKITLDACYLFIAVWLAKWHLQRTQTQKNFVVTHIANCCTFCWIRLLFTRLVDHALWPKCLVPIRHHHVDYSVSEPDHVCITLRRLQTHTEANAEHKLRRFQLWQQRLKDQYLALTHYSSVFPK